MATQISEQRKVEAFEKWPQLGMVTVTISLRQSTSVRGLLRLLSLYLPARLQSVYCCI